jgi:hypothetical protein
MLKASEVYNAFSNKLECLQNEYDRIGIEQESRFSKLIDLRSRVTILASILLKCDRLLTDEEIIALGSPDFISLEKRNYPPTVL